MHFLTKFVTTRDQRALKLVSANQWPISFKILTDLQDLVPNMPTKFRSDQSMSTWFNRCSNLIGQWRPCFLRYANILLGIHGPLGKDTAYQISSNLDKRSGVHTFFVSFFIAPPCGQSTQFFYCDLRLTSNTCIPRLVKFT